MDTPRALLEEPLQRKILAKFNKTSAESLDVSLINESSKLKPGCRVYKMPNNSRYLLDYPRNIYLCPVLVLRAGFAFCLLHFRFIAFISFSQLCHFLNACCLSDRSLCSSRWAMIFEQAMCSSNLQGTQVKETGR